MVLGLDARAAHVIELEPRMFCFGNGPPLIDKKKFEHCFKKLDAAT